MPNVVQALNPNEGLALQSITYEAVGPGGQVGLIMYVRAFPSVCVVFCVAVVR
jgi:hypothetical protein